MACDEAIDFGPRNAEEERVWAEESFRIDIQVAIHELMASKGVTQRELARRMGVSEQRVSQIFADQCNITVRTLAKVYHALGATPRITTEAVDKPIADWQSVPPQTLMSGAAGTAAPAAAEGFARAISKAATPYVARCVTIVGRPVSAAA